METEASVKRTYVGSLRCQRESLLLDGFKTFVISSDPIENNGKKAKGVKKYEVELQDTILFPEGGGQPSDTGFLKLIGDAQNVNIPVDYVHRAGLHAKHEVDRHIEPGTEVEITVDADRRLDYMQQHTGQHLLSAILDTKYKLNTVSWSMGGVPTEKKPQLEINDYFNYVELDGKLSFEEVSEISKIIEDYIILNHQDISVEESTPEQQADVKTHKVPDDYDLEKGILRTIHIGSLDANPCCGTHLTSTSQIGSFLILPNQTNIRGNNSRLYFICGNRVAKYGRLANEILFKSKNILSCPEQEITGKIEKMKDQIQKSSKREQFWMKELATYDAEKISQKLNDTGKAFLLRDEFGALDYLLQVSKELSSTISNFSEYEIVLCGREKQSASGSLIILSESGDKIVKISDSLFALLETLKGGGGKKGGKWQGKIANFSDSQYNASLDYLSTNF
ncbi:hypothetical protein HG535_0D02070 [Zygotorulaspora mrakii]|uniref:Threonyl/alanyl tRNA synthetase SAD domain-containing protein n=1 Tax=Zygotorulaspora mrakii TaxID=42260 RepID=A0A7H9B3I3_ZYGMR|nr:uncharacterized protein HG535_0D02070 [Zygotorulaspora mrakii]QLG72499.1 hypothetical protein HG535_0D02070 [Zygotorulaspora mrakii]